MSNEIPSPVEKALNPSGKEVVRQTLETMSIGPEMMHAFARETMQGAELLGTNLTLDVRKKVTNPQLFGYDYKVEGVGDEGDGPNHIGYAKIFVATEGVRPMITGREDGTANGAVNMIIRETLKCHRKGMESSGLKLGDDIITSKAGSLSSEQKERLVAAEQAVVEHLLERVAGTADLSEESGLTVARWIGSGADQIDGMAIMAEIGDRMTPILAELVQLTEQGEE